MVAHGAGLEGAAGLDVFEFQEDPTSCGAGEGCGFDERSRVPGGFVGWRRGGREDAAHCDGLLVSGFPSGYGGGGGGGVQLVEMMMMMVIRMMVGML